MRVVVLGGGLVGLPMALDLARDDGIEVTLADSSTAVLERAAATHPEIVAIRRDLSDPTAVRELVSDFDYAVNALPDQVGSGRPSLGLRGRVQTRPSTNPK